MAGPVDLLDWPSDALPHLSLVSGRPGLDRLWLDFIGNFAAMFSGATQSARYLDELYPLDHMAMVTAFFSFSARVRGPVRVWDEFALRPNATVAAVRVERLSMPFEGADGDACRFITLHHVKPLNGSRPQRLQINAPGIHLLARRMWRIRV